jgi:hypothetical protein
MINGKIVITSSSTFGIMFLTVWPCSSGRDHGGVPLMLACRGGTPAELTRWQRRWARTSSNRKQRAGPLAGSLGACPSGRQQRRSAPLRAQQQGARCSRGMGIGAAALGRDDAGPGWPRHMKKTPASCKREELPW